MNLLSRLYTRSDHNLIEKLGYEPWIGVMGAGQVLCTERGLLYNTPLGTGRLKNTGDDGEPPHAQVHQTPLEQEWQRSSPELDDPGTRLVRALSRREGSATSGVVRSRTPSPAAGGDAEARLLYIRRGLKSYRRGP